MRKETPSFAYLWQGLWAHAWPLTHEKEGEREREAGGHTILNCLLEKKKFS